MPNFSTDTLFGPGLDVHKAGPLLIGPSGATEVDIARAGVPTNVLGPLNVTGAGIFGGVGLGGVWTGDTYAVNPALGASASGEANVTVYTAGANGTRAKLLVTSSVWGLWHDGSALVPFTLGGFTSEWLRIFSTGSTLNTPLTVTGGVTGQTWATFTNSVTSALFDALSAVNLNIGTSNATSVTLGTATTGAVVPGTVKVGSGAVIGQAGDIGASRNASPNRGALYLGNSAISYLYFDGSNYQFGTPQNGTGLLLANDYTLFNGSMNGDTLIPSIGMAAMANGAAVLPAGPVNDMLAFNPPGLAETSANGTTWTSIAVPTALFAGRIKQTWTGYSIPQSTPYLRFTWSPLGYRFFNYLLAACSTNGNNIQFIVEYSPNGTTWTTWGTSGWKQSWPGYIGYSIQGTPGGSNPYLRITVQRDTTNANGVDLGQLCFYGAYGGTNNLFDWDASKNLTFPANLTVQGALGVTGAATLGSLSVTGSATVSGTLSATGVAKAWAKITIGASGAATITAGSGISSASWSTNVLTVNLSPSLSDANYAPVAVVSGGSNLSPASLATTSFQLVQWAGGTANNYLSGQVVYVAVFR